MRHSKFAILLGALLFAILPARAATISSANFAPGIGAPTAAMAAISPATYIQSITLVANTAQSVTLPAGTRVVNIASEANVWVDFNAQTAVIPSSAVSTGIAAALNPGPRNVFGLTIGATYNISIISRGSPNVTIECWQ